MTSDHVYIIAAIAIATVVLGGWMAWLGQLEQQCREVGGVELTGRYDPICWAKDGRRIVLK